MLKVNIDVVSDVMCPWCYIGKRRLEEALEKLNGEIDVSIRWRPYQLDATLPKEGKDRKQYLEDKFGGAEGAKQAYQNVIDAGKEEKIPFNFDAIEKSQNTLDAHRLIKWAGGVDEKTQNALVENLFKKYFINGQRIGDDDILLEAAKEADMDVNIIEKLLKGDDDKDNIGKEIETAQRMGVTGVPCFVVNDKYAIMGAQPSNVLENAIREIAAKSGDEPQG